MKKLTLFLAVIFSLLIMVPVNVYADFAERQVGFVVIDKSGNIDGETYSSWRQVVKWAYHFPDYKITDSELPQKIVASALREDVDVNAELLRNLAEESKVDVLVVAKVYDLDDTIVSSGFGFHNDSTYVRVAAVADLYVYKKDNNKFLEEKVRERELKELGNYEKPQHTLRMEISRIVNTMEGRPIIGSGN